MTDKHILIFAAIAAAVVAILWCFTAGPCGGDGGEVPNGLRGAISRALNISQQNAPAGSDNPLKDGQ